MYPPMKLPLDFHREEPGRENWDLLWIYFIHRSPHLCFLPVSVSFFKDIFWIWRSVFQGGEGKNVILRSGQSHLRYQDERTKVSPWAIPQILSSKFSGNLLLLQTEKYDQKKKRTRSSQYFSKTVKSQGSGRSYPLFILENPETLNFSYLNRTASHNLHARSPLYSFAPKFQSSLPSIQYSASMVFPSESRT